jgi:uncharacterized protein YyaL (SSP411 family)
VYFTLSESFQYKKGSIWTIDELRNVLNTSELELVTKFYNIEPYGNWEKGNNILFRQFSPEEFIREEGISNNEFTSTLATAKKKLFKSRQGRNKPTVDDKSLTSWNALMVDAYLMLIWPLEHLSISKMPLSVPNL